MIRTITTYGDYFDEFMKTLDDKTRYKIQQGLLLLATQERLSTKFVKSIKEGLFELRTLWNGNIYRVFFIFYNRRIVVLFNVFQNKTQKTPEGEINKALKIKAEYYENKK